MRPCFNYKRMVHTWQRPQRKDAFLREFFFQDESREFFARTSKRESLNLKLNNYSI